MKRGKISNYIRDRQGDKSSPKARKKYIFHKQKKIREGDTVMVIAGDDIHKTGVVLSCKADRALVQGINVCKKAVKPSELNRTGGHLDLERTIHVSNLKVCIEGDKPVKLKVRTTDEGARELVYQVKNKTVLYRPIKNKKT